MPPHGRLVAQVVEVGAQRLDLRFDPFGMAQQQVALFGRCHTSARPVGLVRAHILDAHAHGAQAGKHLERVDVLAAVAAVAAAAVPVDRADQPDLLVVAQRGLAEPAAPGDILNGEGRHDCSKANLKRLKSRIAGDADGQLPTERHIEQHFQPQG